MWAQRTIELPPRARGFHLITREVEEGLPELGGIRVGLVHLFIRHTSASLALNENASADVRRDLEEWFRRAVPDGAHYFRHRIEGPDDMPAHVKAALTATSISIPIHQKKLALGTWQGIYLWEHRRRGSRRELVLHIAA